MIYFAQAESGSLIKIGCTENLVLRLYELTCKSGTKLSYLGVMDGSFPEETRLHRQFAHLLAKGREWFRPEADLLQFIQENARAYVRGAEGAGVVLKSNLVRLGYAEIRASPAQVSKAILENTGEHISVQRIAGLLNSIRISPSVINRLAKGLGVKPAELTKWTPTPKGKGKEKT